MWRTRRVAWRRRTTIETRMPARRIFMDCLRSAATKLPLWERRKSADFVGALRRPSSQRSGRALVIEELQVVQLAVDAAPREQLLVRPDLHDRAAVEDDDLVRAADRGEAVR